MGETKAKVSGELVKLLFVFLLLIPISAFSQEEEVDHVALASMLIKDGHFSRAEKVLEKVKDEDGDKAFIESLWGMVELHKKNYEKAIERFNVSLKQGLNNGEIYIYMAEAWLNLKEYSKAEYALQKTDEVTKSKLPFYLLTAEIHWLQKNKEKAWEALRLAEAKKLSHTVINKKKFSYLLEESLYYIAYELALKMMEDKAPWTDVLAMASQLRIKKQYDFSIKILQGLALLQPYKEGIALELTQNYLALGETFSAALILEESARVNTALSFEASELLRQVGKNYRSRYLNMQTLDPQKRLKQKLSLYLEEDDYHSLKLMIPQLEQHQLLEDEELRYAMAYSLFRTGDFNKSEEYLKVIERDDLFEKSLELRREIGKCREESWACRETI